jgi:hypothetical protein
MHLSVIVPTLNRVDTAPLIAGHADLLVAPVREFLYLLGDRCPVLLREALTLPQCTGIALIILRVIYISLPAT